MRGIFGTYENPRVNSFLDLLICLFKIATSQTFELAFREEAQALINAFLQFQTILSAFIFLTIFEETLPLSEYLQAKGLDMVKAWNMVQIASTNLKRMSPEFGEIHTAAKSYAEKVNEQLEEMAKDMQFSSRRMEDKFEDTRVEVALKERRIRKRKRLAGEAADEGRSLDALTQFQVDTHNVVRDRAVEALQYRFASHKSLFADLSCLDPTRFEDILLYGIPEGALSSIYKLASSINVESLRDELNSFAQNYSQLKRTLSTQSRLKVRMAKERAASQKE